MTGYLSHQHTYRVINRRNALDEETVSSSSINVFKNRLNKIRLTRMGYFMEWFWLALGLPDALPWKATRGEIHKFQSLYHYFVVSLPGGIECSLGWWMCGYIMGKQWIHSQTSRYHIVLIIIYSSLFTNMVDNKWRVPNKNQVTRVTLFLPPTPYSASTTCELSSSVNMDAINAFLR